MNEKLAKKLSKILAKAGLEEDKVDEILADVEEALAEEGAQEGDNPEETPLPPSEENEGDVPPSEEGAGDVPQEGDAPIPPELEGDVPPEEGAPLPPQEGDGSIEDALGQLAAQEGDVPPAPQEEVPPIPQEPQLPPIDPSIISDLTNQLGEANKTIEALKAQVDSLYAALKEAGVISGGTNIGDETPRVTPNASSDQEDAFDDILATINGK